MVPYNNPQGGNTVITTTSFPVMSYRMLHYVAQPTATNTSVPLPTSTSTVVPTATATPCPAFFTDVPCADPFYGYVQGLAAQGVISGYPCGGVNEPCVEPTNRPYYRGGANLTRNQGAKIVYLALAQIRAHAPAKK
jgi:hypothetical protein